MNPEFQRNLWLEVPPRRAAFLATVLLLVFLAAQTIGGAWALGLVAEYLFYALVVLWGTRNAAQAVVGEIRDRTWDFQRLGAITPFAMTWGKLFGSTAFVWLGGALCLVARLGVTLHGEGLGAALFELFYFLSVGLMGQAGALFASLIAVRRRQSHSRFDVVVYQLAGIAAAWWVWFTWQYIASDNATAPDARVAWWAVTMDIRLFYFGSLLAFLGWAFVGCYRLMRAELQLENGPAVWLGFLVFIAIYAAGFDPWSADYAPWTGRGVSARLHAAAQVLGALTYAAALLEQKDFVLYRWLVAAVRGKRFAEAFGRAQAWMISYAGAALLAVMFMLSVAGGASGGGALFMLAALGFMTRDLAIIFLFPALQGRRGGELPALVSLTVLYAVLPPLFGASAFASPVFYPVAGWDGALIAWIEAGAVWAGLAAWLRRKNGAALIRPLNVSST